LTPIRPHADLFTTIADASVVELERKRRMTSGYGRENAATSIPPLPRRESL
jgi:hypothetical protein